MPRTPAPRSPRRSRRRGSSPSARRSGSSLLVRLDPRELLVAAGDRISALSTTRPVRYGTSAASATHDATASHERGEERAWRSAITAPSPRQQRIGQHVGPRGLAGEPLGVSSASIASRPATTRPPCGPREAAASSRATTLPTPPRHTAAAVDIGNDHDAMLELATAPGRRARACEQLALRNRLFRALARFVLARARQGTAARTRDEAPRARPRATENESQASAGAAPAPTASRARGIVASATISPAIDAAERERAPGHSG